MNMDLTKAFENAIKDGGWKFLNTAELKALLPKSRALGNTSPELDYIFQAFRKTKYKNLKVVLYGKDPYGDPNVANGLAFGFKCKKKDCGRTGGSLFNLLKRLNISDQEISEDLTLEGWAQQGVLLLNRYLTVRANGDSGSHRKEWQKFFEQTLRALVADRQKKKHNWVLVCFGFDEKDRIQEICNRVGLEPLISLHPAGFNNARLKKSRRDQEIFLEINRRLAPQKIDWQKFE